VKEKYGSNGNVSVPPPVILKLILLLVFYNVRSERELMDTLSERIDWLWFLGFDLDSEIPDHSVLSKARKRWGVEAFKGFFERIVLQCVKAGLVDGSKLFVDSSLTEADASNNSVLDTHSLKRYLNKSYMELERRLEESEGAKEEDKIGDNDNNGVGKKVDKANNRYLSTTDPDASIVKRKGRKAKLQYQTHRAVDGAYEVITATEVTGGDVNEAHRLAYLMDSHHENTGKSAETVIGDSKYGTIENYLSCNDRGVQAHIPDLKKSQEKTGRRAGIFSENRFKYDKDSDTYLCPAGEILKPRKVKKERDSIDYGATKKVCTACAIKSECTKSKTGRTVKRHFRQEELDRMSALSDTAVSRRDIKTRQHLMERCFARATRYGYKRTRWRRLWRVEIQEYLTSAIQNIAILIRHNKDPKRAGAMAMPVVVTEELSFKVPHLTLELLNDVLRSTILPEVSCSDMLTI
jgi:transposase